MKSVTFDVIISFESLLAAHQKARCCKQHKKEVIEYEMHLCRNLWALHYDLMYHRYKIGEYRKFLIYDPKEREIQAISYRDRIVQHSLCDNLLIPVFEKNLINANCACRVGKGTDYAIRLLRSFMVKHYKKYGKSGYFVKLDVKKYFPSIDHNLLYTKLAKFKFDKDIDWLLHIIIDSYGGKTGLPMGNQSSQCFALVYLDRIDRIIKERMKIKYYVRYMDDMILLVKDKNIAVSCLNVIRLEIGKENIELNHKSQIIKVDNGVEFLGWKFSYGKYGKIIQKIKNQSKKRIFTKVKVRYKKNGSQVSEQDKINSIASYRGYLSRGNGWKVLKKLICIIGR